MDKILSEKRPLTSRELTQLSIIGWLFLIVFEFSNTIQITTENDIQKKSLMK